MNLKKRAIINLKELIFPCLELFYGKKVEGEMEGIAEIMKKLIFPFPIRDLENNSIVGNYLITNFKIKNGGTSNIHLGFEYKENLLTKKDEKKLIIIKKYFIDRERPIKESKFLLKHKNISISRLLCHGNDPNDKYVQIIEFIEGYDLEDFLKHVGTVNERKAREIVSQTVKILLELRGENISHRDLKPSNIMLSYTHQVVLIDFTMISDEENNKSRLGTLKYMAPEVYNQLQYTAEKVDVWSLAIILCDMILGLNHQIKCRIDLKCHIDKISTLAQELLFEMLDNEQSLRCTLSEVETSDWMSEEEDFSVGFYESKEILSDIYKDDDHEDRNDLSVIQQSSSVIFDNKNDGEENREENRKREEENRKREEENKIFIEKLKEEKREISEKFKDLEEKSNSVYNEQNLLLLEKQKLLEEVKEVILIKDKGIEEKEKAILQLQISKIQTEDLIIEKDFLLNIRENDLRSKDSEIIKLEKELKIKENELKNKDLDLEEKELRLEEKELLVSKSNRQLLEIQKKSRELEEKLQENISLLQKKDLQINTLNLSVQEGILFAENLKTSLYEMKGVLIKKDEEILQKEKDSRQKEDQIKLKEEEIKQKTEEILLLNNNLLLLRQKESSSSSEKDQKILSLQSLQDELKQKISILEEKFQASQLQLQNSNLQVISLQSDLDKKEILQKSHDLLKQDNETFQRELLRATKENLTLNELKDISDKSLLEMRNRLDLIEIDLNQKISDLEDSRKSVNSLKNELEESLKKIKSLEQNLLSLNNEHLLKLENSQNEINSLQQKCKGLEVYLEDVIKIAQESQKSYLMNIDVNNLNDNPNNELNLSNSNILNVSISNNRLFVPNNVLNLSGSNNRIQSKNDKKIFEQEENLDNNYLLGELNRLQNKISELQQINNQLHLKLCKLSN